jgi:hypothetical protein
MRYLRAFVGVVGASGSIIAAGGLVLAVLSTALAFHGWPDVRTAQTPGSGSTELADGGDASGSGEGRGAVWRGVTTLPAVPVAAARSTRTAATSGERRRRRTSRRDRSAHAPSVNGRDDASGAAPTQGPTAPAATPDAGAAGGGAKPATGGSGSGGSGSGSGASGSGSGSGVHDDTPPVLAAPSTPSTPSSSPGVADAAGQAVQNTTQAAGDAVSGATDGVGQAVAPVSPTAADTVTQVGQTVGQTVTQVGQTVGGILGGLGGGR